MSILIINLKQLYQRISLIVLWLCFIGFLVPIVTITLKGSAGVFGGVFVWYYLFGLFTASIPVEVITKPFTFCLPGHNNIPLKFLSCVCFSSACLFFIIFLFYPEENVAHKLATAMSIAMAGTMFYWLGAWVVFRFPNWQFTIAFMGLLGLSQKFNIPEIVKYIIVKEWLAVICSGIFVNILAYLHWSRKYIARKYCGKMWLGAFDAWNKQRLKVYTESRMVAKNKSWKISPAIESFFIKRITYAGPNFERYIWGSLYHAFAIMFSQQSQSSRGFLIGCILLLCLGYTGSFTINVIFVIPSLMMIQAYMPIHSPMLIAGGRKERFWASFATIVADTIFVLLVTSSFALLSILITPIMPAITISDRELQFTPLDTRFFFIPSLMIPLMITVRLLLHKMPVLMMFVNTIIFGAVWGAVIAFFETKRKAGFVPYVNPLSIMCLIIMAWLIFTLILRHICMKRNLV
ncbi:MAG: hypothetical protein ABFD79_03495 [Phycisphaerales bacterium]